MRLVINKIEIHNFQSYKYAELDFNNYTGTSIISGQNNYKEDATNSNGSGKSTIFSALVWCLTGNTLNENTKLTNDNLSGKLSVKVDFTYDTYKAQIIRGQKPNKLNLIIDDEDKSGKTKTETEKIILDFFPNLTYDLLSIILVLNQGLTTKLSALTPSKRKEQLENLFQTHYMYETLSNKLKRYSDKIKEELFSLTNSKQYNNQEINRLNSDSFSIKEQLDKIKSISTSKKEEKDDIDNQLANLNKQLVPIKDNAIKIDNDIKLVSADLMELETSKQEQFNTIDTSSIVNAQAELKSLYSQAQPLKRIIDLANTDCACPTCGQTINNIQTIQAKYNSLASSAQKIKTDALVIKDKIEAKREFIENNVSIARKDLNDKKEKLCIQQEENKNLLNNLVNQINQLQIKSAELSSYSDLISNNAYLENKLEENKKLLSELSDSVIKIEEDIVEVEKRQSASKSIETLLTRDFRGELLRDQLQLLKNETKKLSTFIYDYDVYIELNGNKLDIKVGDKYYEQLSGGERQKVDVLIQLALREALCKYYNISTNLLVLDEVTDNLDKTGCDSLMSMLVSNSVTVDNLFIISHHLDDFDIPYDYHFTAVKDSEGISCLIQN